MTDKIVTLETRPVQANKSAVEVLRVFMDMAERGEIVGVAIAAVEPGGACRTQCSTSDYFHGLLGALEVLKFRMLENRGTE